MRGPVSIAVSGWLHKGYTKRKKKRAILSALSLPALLLELAPTSTFPEIENDLSTALLEQQPQQEQPPVLVVPARAQNSEETTRNVAAACLGKLAAAHPSGYLPQLHAIPAVHQPHLC
ncbi:hypothetical protein C8R44DRAFT_876175 [Mycena epipterygia]|nr:hypothetical protein C8R44DRAFT_876175 [Mycena epipterygia]